MCPICWMTAFTSVSILVAVSGALIAARDRASVVLAALLASMGVARGLDAASPSLEAISFVGVALTARVLWTVAWGPKRMSWREIWRRAKGHADLACPAKAKQPTRRRYGNRNGS